MSHRRPRVPAPGTESRGKGDRRIARAGVCAITRPVKKPSKLRVPPSGVRQERHRSGLLGPTFGSGRPDRSDPEPAARRLVRERVNNAMTIVAAIVAVLLLGYLVVALLRPEKF